jgi:hypothetical protein
MVGRGQVEEEERDGPSDHSLSNISAWFLCSQSWHFLTVPPNSQYYFLFHLACDPSQTSN